MGASIEPFVYFLLKLLKHYKRRPPIFPGSTGENLSIQGLEWSLMISGKLSIGETVIELTNPAPPCKTIKDSFKDGEFNRISEKKILVFKMVCKSDKEG